MPPRRPRDCAQTSGLCSPLREERVPAEFGQRERESLCPVETGRSAQSIPGREDLPGPCPEFFPLPGSRLRTSRVRRLRPTLPPCCPAPTAASMTAFLALPESGSVLRLAGTDLLLVPLALRWHPCGP